MNLNGPIVIIEDDEDEVLILKEILKDIVPEHEIYVIPSSIVALDWLRKTEKPFLTLSAINLSAQNGFELRGEMLQDPELTRKCTPFIFYSAHATSQMLKKVYDLGANGYFHDLNDYTALRKTLNTVVEYWKQCAV